MHRILIAAAGALALTGPAAAQSLDNPPTETVLCLDVGGRSLPPVCKVPGSRLDPREDICICREGMRVIAPICPPGVRPPAESVAYEKARQLAARDGTLVGDLYEGRPMCVAPRTP
ncbi:MAG: hypothetical protein ACK41C_12125 [Phenylobacterium sp.]|jgi:hypothetical protein|uniref:hypothetical protein n=1 Tax=Phenylobacterium sp. TaxID=1871053 RepID=UPI00391DC2AE